jgi:hypothetical protein
MVANSVGPHGQFSNQEIAHSGTVPCELKVDIFFVTLYVFVLCKSS